MIVGVREGRVFIVGVRGWYIGYVFRIWFIWGWKVCCWNFGCICLVISCVVIVNFFLININVNIMRF